jgi:hypothetical protein
LHTLDQRLSVVEEMDRIGLMKNIWKKVRYFCSVKNETYDPVIANSKYRII